MNDPRFEFYKYIIKSGDGYSIKKGNERYGNYRKLSDALYERDRLIQVNWDWDALVELEETENFYEKMNLPKFIHEYSYINRVAQRFKVYKDDIFRGSFNNKKDAYNYAETIGGEVEESGVVYKVVKKVDGRQRHFGQFKTIEEAVKRRNELVEKGWSND